MSIPPSSTPIHQGPHAAGDELRILVVHPDLFGGPVHVPYLLSLVRNLPQARFRILATRLPKNESNLDLPANATLEFRPAAWIERVERSAPPFVARSAGVVFDVIRALLYRGLVRGAAFDIVHIHVGLEVENLMRVGRRLRLRALWTVARWLSDFRWTRGAVLFTDHSLFTRRSALGFPNPLEEADFAVSRAYPNVICVERDGLAALAAHDDREGVRRNRWHVPNGIDTGRFAFRPLEEHPGFRIGYAGRLGRAGESRTFLSRVAQRLPEGVELHAAVASSIDESKIRAQWFPSGRVVLHRNVSNDEMPAFYWSIDLLVNPMLWAALGRVTLESMSCGRPVAMFSNSDRYPVTSDSGILFPPDDVDAFLSAVRRLAADRTHLATLARNARGMIEREFDERHVAKATSKIYESVARASRGGAGVGT